MHSYINWRSSQLKRSTHGYWFQDLSLLSLCVSCGTCNVLLVLLHTNYRDTRCGCSFPSICDCPRLECCTCSCCDCDCYGNSDGNAHIPWLNQKPAATATAPDAAAAPPAAPPSSCRLFAFLPVFFAIFASCSCYVMMAEFHFCYTRCQTIATYCCTCFPYLSIYPSYPIPHPTHTDS